MCGAEGGKWDGIQSGKVYLGLAKNCNSGLATLASYMQVLAQEGKENSYREEKEVGRAILHWDYGFYWLSCFQERRALYFGGALLGFPGGTAEKNLPTYPKDAGSIPGSERIPGGRNNSPLQYSCLENSMDRGAWRLSPWVAKKSDRKQGNNTHYYCRHESSPYWCLDFNWV